MRPLWTRRGEGLAEVGVADATSAPDLGESERRGRVGEDALDALGGGLRTGAIEHGCAHGVEHLEGECVAVTTQDEGDPGSRCCRAMLDCEGELVACAAQVEIGITPCVKLGAAAQGLSSAHFATAFA